MTGKIEQRLQELGLSLPAPWSLPGGTLIGSTLVRVQGERVFVGGHVPLDSQGQVTGPFGRVGAEVSWLRVGGYVNTAPTFVEYPRVMNAASRLLTELFGEARGRHARLAIGVAGLPWGVPVEIEAELSLVVQQA